MGVGVDEEVGLCELGEDDEWEGRECGGGGDVYCVYGEVGVYGWWWWEGG